MQRLQVLDVPADRGRAVVHLDRPARAPRAIDERAPGDGHRGCAGCGKGGNGAEPARAVWESLEAQREELGQKLGALHWLEQGLVKLEAEVRRRGSPTWGVHVLSSALEGMVEVIEEGMFFCDEVGTQAAGNGYGSSGRAQSGACPFSGAYDRLEQKLRYYATAGKRLERENEFGRVTQPD